MEKTEEEKAKIRQKIEKLKNNKFKQLEIPSWRPVLTMFSTMLCLGFFGVLFLLIGLVVLIHTMDTVELAVHYDTVCKQSFIDYEPCLIDFTLDE